MFNALVFKRPWKVLLALSWLLKGRGFFKSKLFDEALITPVTFPIDPEVKAFLLTQKEERPLLLISGSHQKVLDSFTETESLFDEVIGSDDHTNLVSHKKSMLLVDRYGEKGFDYIGNSDQDLKVWEHAHHCYGANLSTSTYRKASQRGIQIEILSSKANSFLAALKAMRIQQWVKNVLCFVPIITAHLWDDLSSLLAVTHSFVGLCFTSSLIYLVNDLQDISADRKHPEKKFRALAAGALSILHTWVSITVLFIISLFLWAYADLWVVAFVALQIGISLLYTAKLKSIAVLDTILLGVLYSNRIVIGCMAVGEMPTAWLIGFALFFFIGIACVKRYAEIRLIGDLTADVGPRNPQRITGRGYYIHDAALLFNMGYVSSAMSTLILGLYITQPTVTLLYPTSQLLWLLCIIQFYWLNRLWLLTLRKEMHDDPLTFLLKDRVSYICFVISVVVFLLARMPLIPNG